MRSPDHTDAQRIDALLAGAPPESEREAQLEGLIRQLRTSVPPAPPLVREQVRTLHEPERRHWSWRPVLVAVPIAAALVAGAIGLSRSGSDGGRAVQGGGAESFATSPLATQEATGTRRDALRAQGAPATTVESAQLGAADAAAASGRAQEWDVALELRVGDNDRLSDASAEAIRTTRELGGFVVSSNVSTRDRSGEARLVLRVPSRRIQDAIARLSELGTITAQQVQVQDRQDELDRLRRRIDELRVQRAEVNLRLRTESLTPPERLRLELQLQRLTGRLNSLTATRNGVAREVALAEVALTIRTGKSAAAPSEGRLEGAAGDALHVLAVAGAAAIFVLIVTSPLLVIALAVWLGRRSLRRREHERLLDQSHPAAARD